MNGTSADNGSCGSCSCSGSCCGGSCSGSPATLLATRNAPGLRTLDWRVGTRGTFFSAMTNALSSSRYPQLAGLRTRELSDASMAMLEAWATAGDVLTFYQERLVNEGYLGTATQPRSVHELAALVGWRPRPGVAATAYLAYTVDANTFQTVIPAGSRANSIPGTGETMQAFETSDDLAARPAWNALRPRIGRDQTAASIAAKGLYLAGTTTGLAANDALVLNLGTGTVQAVRVKTVSVDNDAGLTHVMLQGWFGGDFGLPFQAQAVAAAVSALHAVAGTITASRVGAVLAQVQLLLGTSSSADLASHVGLITVPAIRQELATAREKGYTRLVPVLVEVLAAMAPIAGRTTAEAPLARMREEAHRGGFDLRKDQSPMDRLVSELLRPASIPPATSQNLERSYKGTFSGSGEVFPQLFTGLHAGLAPTMYQALAGSRISAPSQVAVWTLREAAALFGHNAPVPGSFDENGNYIPPSDDLPLNSDEDKNVAFLAQGYERLQPGEYVLMQRGTETGVKDYADILTQLETVRIGSRRAYGLTGNSTTLVLADPWWDPRTPSNDNGQHTMATLRSSTAYVQQQELELAQEPVDDDVAGNTLELDSLYDGLAAGRWVIVSGERTDVFLEQGKAGVQAAELLMLASVVHSGVSEDGQILPGEERHTFLTFAQPLAYSYKRSSVTVFGNVAHATHGESRAEILGAGNAAAALQQFTLKAPPLTYLAAATPDGVQSTLIVRVNGVQWAQVPGLAYLADQQRGFFTTATETSTTITFGNPPHGQRLPTGTDNVHAAYRSGIGTPGNVEAGQISQLATRPLGVTGVLNPLATSGGANAESMALTRGNAPRAVTALDRLVSVSDYADFAATFAGIGKASSALLHAGGSALVQVTIAGVNDAPIAPSSDVFRNLRSALVMYGDPQLRVSVVVREALALVLSARIQVAADRDWTLVEPSIRAALLNAFGFAEMDLGEDLASSAVIATMAAVPGVDYVDLDVLRAFREDELTAGIADLTGAPPGTPDRPPRRILVAAERVEGGTALPAQLAYFQSAVPDSLILNEVRR